MDFLTLVCFVFVVVVVVGVFFFHHVTRPIHLLTDHREIWSVFTCYKHMCEALFE